MKICVLVFTAAVLAGCASPDGASEDDSYTPIPTRAGEPKTPAGDAPSASPSNATPAQAPTGSYLARVDFESNAQQAFPGFTYSRPPLSDKVSASVSSTTRVALSVPFAAHTELYASFRIRLDGSASNGPDFFAVVDTGGATRLRFTIENGSTLNVIRDGESKPIGTTPVLVVGSSYRIDLHVRSGDNAQVQVAYGSGGLAPLPLVNETLSAPVIAFSRFDFGNLSGDTLSATFDDITVSEKPLP